MFRAGLSHFWITAERMAVDTAAPSIEQSQQRHRITKILPMKGKEPYGNLVTSVNFQNKD